MSISRQLRYGATNCGQQTVALYHGFTVFNDDSDLQLTINERKIFLLQTILT